MVTRQNKYTSLVYGFLVACMISFGGDVQATLSPEQRAMAGEVVTAVRDVRFSDGQGLSSTRQFATADFATVQGSTGFQAVKGALTFASVCAVAQRYPTVAVTSELIEAIVAEVVHDMLRNYHSFLPTTDALYRQTIAGFGFTQLMALRPSTAKPAALLAWAQAVRGELVQALTDAQAQAQGAVKAGLGGRLYVDSKALAAFPESVQRFIRDFAQGEIAQRKAVKKAKPAPAVDGNVTKPLAVVRLASDAVSLVASGARRTASAVVAGACAVASFICRHPYSMGTTLVLAVAPLAAPSLATLLPAQVVATVAPYAPAALTCARVATCVPTVANAVSAPKTVKGKALAGLAVAAGAGAAAGLYMSSAAQDAVTSAATYVGNVTGLVPPPAPIVETVVEVPATFGQQVAYAATFGLAGKA